MSWSMGTQLIWPQCSQCGLNMRYEPNLAGTSGYYICDSHKERANADLQEMLLVWPGGNQKLMGRIVRIESGCTIYLDETPKT